MSTKDISRFLFQPRKHYVGMRLQQGRVSLDSDHNEGAWHDDEDQRLTLLELIGPQGSPDGGFFIGYTTGDGPSGTPVPITVGVNPGITSVEFNNDGTDVPVPNYFIMPGSMYVGGLRVEIEEPEHIAFQSDFLQNSPLLGDIPSDLSSSATVRHHFFFLNVWEQCVTAVEDEEFLERALGGPDTSVRVRRMRRVEYLLAQDGEDCTTALERAISEQTDGLGEFHRETGELRSPGRLWIDFVDGDAEDTCAPCHPDPTGRYLGAENQAMRIMLVDATHFVWAYDNAAPLYRVTIGGISDAPSSDLLVTMLTQPKDEEHWPLADRVVEILPWSAILENGEKVADEVGVFCRVSKSFTPDGDDTDPPKTFRIDRSDSATMAALNELIHAWDDDHPRLANLDTGEEPRKFFVRFWHQVQTGTTPILIPTSSGAPLGTTGLIPHFTADGLRGDFWIAALRPETPDRIVPFDLHTNTAGVQPHGPRHFFAPLVLIHSANDQVTGFEDCRRHIVPVTDSHCCTRIVGDGVHSIGQFTKIQAAIDSLPPEGGKICVRDGLYSEEINIGSITGPIVIEGCGEHTVLVTPDAPAFPSVINIADTKQGVTIRSLRIRAKRGAIGVFNARNIRLLDLDIIEEDPIIGDVTDVPLVRAFPADHVEMRSLRVDTVRTATPPSTQPAILLQGRTHVLADSQITTRSRIGVDVSGDLQHLERLNVLQTGLPGFSPRAAIRATDFIDEARIENCRLALRGELGDDAVIDISGHRIVIANNELVTEALSAPIAWGGAHIRSGERIEFLNNRITGGAGHGITLGSVLWQPEAGGDFHREGAGKGQLRLDGINAGDLRDGYPDTTAGVQFIARADASLENVVISGNRIEFMQGNGISMLTVLGLRDDVPLLEVKNLTIENNRIEENVLGPLFDSMRIVDDATPVGGSANGIQVGSGLEIPVTPYGGIVLSTLTGRAIIRDNIIAGNSFFGGAPSVSHAIGGIFVLFGENLVLTGNHIERNGDIPDAVSTTTVRPGVRAGIAVVHATTGVPDQAFLDEMFPTSPNTIGHTPNAFALRVANNVVRQPEGRALFAVASGSVSVTANFLSSQGFHGTTSPPDTVALGDVVFIQNMGAPWEGLTTEEMDHGPRHPEPALRYLTDTPGALQASPPNDVFFIGQGGHTLFDDNNVVYDWLVQRFPPAGVPLSYFAVSLISTDHVGVHGNQFAIRIDRSTTTSPPLIISPPSPPFPQPSDSFFPEFLLANVFVMAATVHVTSNRFSEPAEAWESVNLSILSYGFLMNTTALNLMTHCHFVVDRGGVIHPAPAGSPGDTLATISGGFQGFSGSWRIEALNNIMFSQFAPSEARADDNTQLSPCWPFMTTNIWQVLVDFTRLVYDKRP